MKSPRIDHAYLGTLDVLRLGAALRSKEQGRGPQTVAEIANRTTSLLFDAIRDRRGQHGLALVRLYRTYPARALTAAERAFVTDASLPDDAPCLVLEASRGLRFAWNDPERSQAHRVIPLPDVAAVKRLPMVSALLDQLGVDVGPLVRGDIDILLGAKERQFGVFFVPEAVGSPHIPAQAEFVDTYGIASAFGFGGILADGSIFTVVAFSLHTLKEASIRPFELFALHVRLALLEATDLRPRDEKTLLRQRNAALEELLDVQVPSIITWGDERTATHRQEAEARERELTANNEKLERTQSAMLNLIEDLREARAALEARVADRTRLLDEANKDLATRNDELSNVNQELREFAYVASHDLQEPLRTIAGYLQLVQKRHSDALPEEAKEFIEFSIASTERLQALIESLLLYSRVTTAGQPRTNVSLQQVVADVQRALALTISETNAKIHASGLPEVLGDRLQMQQLFQNLVNNSIKFRGDAPAQIWIEAVPEDDDFWRVAVRDEGVGFDPKFAESVFRVFRRLQRSQPGTGIGLSICKKIVERHGGWIRADAKPNEGACFEFTLPRTKEHVP